MDMQKVADQLIELLSLPILVGPRAILIEIFIDLQMQFRNPHG